jgi:hypothetical protein
MGSIDRSVRDRWLAYGLRRVGKVAVRYGVVLAMLAVVLPSACSGPGARMRGRVGLPARRGSQDAATDEASVLSGPSHTVALRPRAGEYVVQLPAVSGPC